MKPAAWLIGFGLFSACLPGHVLGMINDFNALVLEPGESFSAAGTIYKNVSIHVKANATLVLPPGTPADQAHWRLQLIAPWVKIEGNIIASGVSNNMQGCGLPGSNTFGPGGSGFAGKGGDGSAAPSSGGPAYDVAYQESPGSKGISNPNGGGGSIRIDALNLSLGASSLLAVNANSLQTTGGGGSGGCILLNGVHTFLTSAYTFRAAGGPGQLQSGATVVGSGVSTPVPSVTFTPQPGGGGGSGGRIKIFTYPDYNNGGGSISVSGGVGGGGTAADGAPGIIQVLPAPIPAIPQLLTPGDQQVVGQNPSFTFSGADSMLSQFLQYHIQITVSTDTAFDTPLESYQSSLDPGWGGRQYYPSNEIATYNQTVPLVWPKTYIWRVRVYNGQGWSPFSSVRQFSTTNNAPPLAPLLVYPSPGQNYVSKTPALQVFGADPNGNSLTFSLILSQDPHLANAQLFQATYPGWDQTSYPSGTTATCQIMNTTTYPDALQPGTTYFWRATAIDFYLGTSASAIGTFTVVGLPSNPTLISPLDQSSVTTKRPDLTMSAAGPTHSALRYKLELSSDSFQTIITFLSESSPGWSSREYASLSTARLQIPEAYGLVPGKTYVWRASAYDLANDNWSETSSAFTFTVITPPLLPQLLSPADGNVAPDGMIPLYFSAISESGNTLTYRCELSADGFGSLVYAADQNQTPAGWSAPVYASGATAQFTLPASLGLARGKTYAWRIQAYDGLSWGSFSAARTFTLADYLEILTFRIYPNPAVRAQTLKLELAASVDADVTVRILNILGKEINRQTHALRGGATPQMLDLDIGNFACGTYFCTLEARSLFGTKKSVKRFAVVN